MNQRKIKTMKTIKEIIEALSKFAPDAIVTVYEGEVTGIVISNKDHELGFIDCLDIDDDNSPKTFEELDIDKGDLARDIEKGDLK